MRRPGAHRHLRLIAWISSALTVCLAVALVGSWVWFRHLMLRAPLPPEPTPVEHPAVASGPVSPLLVRYQLDLPGRGEIFPALADPARNGKGEKLDYWPVAILTLSNSAEKPVLQVVTARVEGWSRTQQASIVVGPGETRNVRLSPELLPKVYNNSEVQRATLSVTVTGVSGETNFAQERPVLLHAGSDLYWGQKFANAQYIARWVTPHDPSVLKLVADARRYIKRGRMPGYSTSSRSQRVREAQVRSQAQALFQAVKRSGFSYVSSIFTFGNYPGQAQRIRLPRETLSLKTANCIDVSVAYASAVENLGMVPLLVIVPGHAFVGVKLGPESNKAVYLDLTVLPKGTFEQAEARAHHWLKKFPESQVLAVDVAATRLMGIYPMPGEANAGD